MPQLRRNPITGEWVVIAPERAKRPNDYIKTEAIKSEAKVACIFCPPAGKAYKKHFPDFEDEITYVTPNSYPAYIENPKLCSKRSYRVEEFYRMGPSLGGHDIVVIKKHNTNLPSFDIPTWEAMFLMIQKRYKHFRKICNAQYTMPIYNYKMAAGASISHPHAQIFASNIIPNVVAKEIQGSESYFEKHGQCVFCAMNRHEQEEKKRVVFETTRFIAHTFFAAKFPFEIWISPKEHLSRFENEDGRDIKELSATIKAVIAKLYSTLHDPPLNFFIHSLPNTMEDAKFYHWHLEIAPRVSNFGGYELGSGVIIDVISPEKAAEYLNSQGH